MGKTGKWLKNFLVGGKKDYKQKDQISDHPSPTPSDSRSTPISIPKERRRWSFRRPAKELNSPEISLHGFSEPDAERRRHAMAVAVATAAAADAAVAAAQAAAAVVRLTSNSTKTAAADAARTAAVEDYAAVRVQAVFRGYLARKALRALKGLVKLQALARGHLVRKQATATLRCMQALVTVQARARAQRIKMIDDTQGTPQHKLQTPNRRSPQHPRFRQSYETDRSVDENVKIVEVDLGESMNSSKSRGSYSVFRAERTDQRLSPAPSALTDVSPVAFSGHFEDFSFVTAQSSPNCFSATSMPFVPMSNECPFFPNYMANTESSRAKVRSQSAPKQRPDSGERPPSRMRPSVDGRNIPRGGGVRMQRSTSHVGATVNGYQYPPSVKLDRSNLSLQESECGSTSTIMTNADYGRSFVSFEVHGSRY